MKSGVQFLAQSAERRALAIAQAATERGIDPVIMEKDFWVCWLLALMFAQPELAPHVVFKGGTSLSKVFHAIDRFSEDIDLSLTLEFVEADPDAFTGLTSRTKRDRAMATMQGLCATKTESVVLPLLETRIREQLGAPPEASWLSYETEQGSGYPVLYFQYPTSLVSGFDYFLRNVKLELGSLTDQQPTGRYAIRPWLADTFPALFGDWECEVTALEVARSFWEKATILHAEYYRPLDQPTPVRYSRHHADTARLLDHPEATTFVADRDLCERVATWKETMFARAWAQYGLARHGTLRLVPPPARRADLAADYAAMRPMFLVDPPPLEQVLARLEAAEETINGSQ